MQQAAADFPGQAEPMVMEAILLGSYADYQQGFGAVCKLKAARELLYAAEKINPTVLEGAIYVTLGILHYKAPRWPLSYGNDQKAREYLEKAIQINPDGIDPNFYYDELLMKQKNYAKAEQYLNKAMAASPRPGREDADSSRRLEIRQMLETIRLRTVIAA